MFVRIRRALDEAPARGQTELMQRVLGASYSLDEFEAFKLALKLHLTAPATVTETRMQVPGTGEQGPAVYEYVYANVE